MNLRFIDWIWHIRGSVPLAPEQSSDDAYDRLDALLHEPGTSQERTGGTLIFRKKDQLAQDKLSVFSGGVLQVEPGVAGSVLRYDLSSHALLACFLAPLLFLGIAQMTIAIGALETPTTEADGAAKKDAAKKDTEVKLNPIDAALGAPAPEKPKKDKAEDGDSKDNGPKPTTAYVFAAIFAVLYIVGRILEDRLLLARFKKCLWAGTSFGLQSRGKSRLIGLPEDASLSP